MAYILLHFPSVQTYLTHKIASNLSESLNAKISIGSVDVRPLKSIVLRDVLVEDQAGDSLLFIEELSADITDFDYENSVVEINDLDLQNVYAALKKDSVGVMNFQFIIDQLSSNEPKDTTSKVWTIFCNELNIENSRLLYKSFFSEKMDSAVNFNDLFLTDLNINLEDILFHDSINMNINILSFKDKCGFTLENLSSIGHLDQQNIVLNNLDLLAGKTHIISKELAFNYKDFDDFDDFINNVKISLNLDSSVVSASDLAFFVPTLRGFDQDINISGDIKGKINRLKLKKLNLQFADHTVIKGDFSLEGLPDINRTYIHCDIDQIITNKTDLEKIKLPPFDEIHYLELPYQLAHFGNISFKGNFTGFIDDFVTYGDFVTNIGKISSDISIKRDSTNRLMAFNGKVKTNHLNAGKLIEQDSIVGKLTFNGEIDGKLYDDGHMQADVDATVNSLDLNKYTYKDIKIIGELTEKLFNGEINIEDPNIKANYSGKIDFSGQKPVFDFVAEVNDAHLFNLNLENTDSLSSLSAFFEANVTGIDPDNMTGNVKLKKSILVLQSDTVEITNMVIVSYIGENSRNITISSDQLDAEIAGDFKFVPLINLTSNIFFDIFPSLGSTKKYVAEKDTLNTIDFNLRLKDVNKALKMFKPELEMGSNTIIDGILNTADKSFDLSINSDEINYDNKIFYDLKLTFKLQDKLFITESICNRLALSDNYSLSNFELNFEGYNDSLLCDMHWVNRDSTIYSGDIAALTSLSKNGEKLTPIAKIKLIPSELILADELWSISESVIIIDTTSIRISDLTISKDQQVLNLFGALSERKTDSLFVSFHNVDLSNINQITDGIRLNFGGIINGESNLSDIYNNPVFYSNIDIDEFVFNDERLGKVAIISNWDNLTEKINLIVRLKNGRLEPFVLAGEYTPKTEALNFGITVQMFAINTLQPYVKDYLILNGNGVFNDGAFELTGTLSDPKFSGKIKITKGNFTVNYLQTTYNFTDYVYINNSTILFDNIIIHDEFKPVGESHQATLGGVIYHENFKNPKFDITLNANEFAFLNTTEKDNSSYYGKAIVSGLVNVTGEPSNINIDVSAKTEAGTKFNIPLSSGSELNEHSFVTFVNNNDQKKEKEKDVDLSGVQLNFELEVTPEAEVQIIFDEKVGDIIKGRGSGNLKMEINTLGNFNMYGDYMIESGDYLFTLENIINKHFEVEKGGTIKWNGSPYDAYVDMNAVYRLKAPMYDLMVGMIDSTEQDKYKRRIPVECHLKMTETILNPEINFGIEVPLADDKANSVLNSLTTEEMNKQLISLLILNSFYTPSNVRGVASAAEIGGAGARGTSSELLSNQLSHWLSQISNDFDIGVNYRPGDEISSDELEVALSTQLFNDRVSVNGNVGMGGQQQSTSGIVGDFDVNVKINKSGKLQLKAFTRSNDELIYENSPNTQGIGLFYREDFDSFKDLINRLWFMKKNEEAEKEPVADPNANKTNLE